MSLAVVILLIIAALIGAPLFAIFGAASMILFDDPEAGTTITSVAIDVFSERFADSPTLVTLPLFTFAGYLMAESGTPQRLVRASRALLGWMPGGLALVCLVASAFFTTFTGGSGITIVAIGGLLFPALIQERYKEGFSLGLVTTGGSLGLLFPPSIPIVLYAVVAQILIDKLFIAGLIPGMVTMLALGAYAYVIGGGHPRRLAFILIGATAFTAVVSVQSTEITCDGRDGESVCVADHWTLITGTDRAEVPGRRVAETPYASLYTSHGRSYFFPTEPESDEPPPPAGSDEEPPEGITVTGPVADQIYEWRHPETTITLDSVEGVLERTGVRPVLNQSNPAFTRCLAAVDGASVDVSFSIDAEGHVAEPSLGDLSEEDALFGCLNRTLEAQRFERMGGTTEVRGNLSYQPPPETFEATLTGFGGEGDFIWLILIMGVCGFALLFAKPRAQDPSIVLPPRPNFDAQEAFASMWHAKWEAILPVVLVAGLATGLLRIHEAAAFTALYVLIIEIFVYKDIDPRKDLTRVIKESMTMLGAILAILATALGFTSYLIQARVPELMVEWMEEFISSPIMFLLALNLFLLIVGMLMDIFSAIVVVVPLIVPIARAFNIDPYHLGIVFLLNLEIGYLTPPVGLNLFISSFRFNKPVTRLYTAVLPFIVLLVLSLVITAYVPSLSTLFTGLIETQEISAEDVDDMDMGDPMMDDPMMDDPMMDDMGGDTLDDMGGGTLDDLGDDEFLDDLGGGGGETLDDLGGGGAGETLDDLGGGGAGETLDDLGGGGAGETLDDLGGGGGAGETLDDL